jgi:hypothetical protein
MVMDITQTSSTLTKANNEPATVCPNGTTEVEAIVTTLTQK